jgi:hypothetical protein
MSGHVKRPKFGVFRAWSLHTAATVARAITGFHSEAWTVELHSRH